MRHHKWLVLGSLVLIAASMAGCAKAARDTKGFALENTITVDMPFKDAWQMVKGVLREQDLEIYTRDKRGTFVAFSKPRKFLGFMERHRVKYTIEVAPVSEEETRVYIETVRQVYGVTLLTYPDWHDRKTSDSKGTTALLQAIEAKVKAR
jgi:hypothetical protein